MGHVKIGDQDEVGVILLNTGQSDVLVGMEFLRVFKRTLLISDQDFVLVDTETVQKLFHDALEVMKKAVQVIKKQVPPESDSPGPGPRPSQTPPTTDI